MLFKAQPVLKELIVGSEARSTLYRRCLDPEALWPLGCIACTLAFSAGTNHKASYNLHELIATTYKSLVKSGAVGHTNQKGFDKVH